jgi:hypothetical protein
LIQFTLKDTYGNPVVDAPNIKKVTTNISFENNVDKDQIVNNDL